MHMHMHMHRVYYNILRLQQPSIPEKSPGPQQSTNDSAVGGNFSNEPMHDFKSLLAVGGNFSNEPMMSHETTMGAKKT